MDRALFVLVRMEMHRLQLTSTMKGNSQLCHCGMPGPFHMTRCSPSLSNVSDSIANRRIASRRVARLPRNISPLPRCRLASGSDKSGTAVRPNAPRRSKPSSILAGLTTRSREVSSPGSQHRKNQPKKFALAHTPTPMAFLTRTRRARGLVQRISTVRGRAVRTRPSKRRPFRCRTRSWPDTTG